MPKMSCPICESDHDADLTTYEETVTIKGIEITYENKSYLCKVTGEIFDTPATLDKNLWSAQKLYIGILEEENKTLKEENKRLMTGLKKALKQAKQLKMLLQMF